MPSSDQSPDVLCEEVLAEGRREAEEILARARQQAEAARAKATADAKQAAEAVLASARGDASCWTELALAILPVEAGRRRGARIEELLESVHDEVRRRLLARDGFDYRATVVELAAEAIGRMSGEAFVVKLSPADRSALGEGLAAEIVPRAGRTPLRVTLSEDAAITAGGTIVQDADGRQIWDNRLAPRLERLWPELRRQVAVAAKLVDGVEPPGGGA